MFYDLFNKDKDYKGEIEFVYRWAKNPKSIFDIGAGTGSYWKYYPKGTDIFGIDKSISMAKHSNNIVHGDITKYVHSKERFDCATALFDVLNYIPNHDWWSNIPVKKGGYFVFDIWSKDKIEKDGFKKTFKKVGEYARSIDPIKQSSKFVDLRITILKTKFDNTAEVGWYEPISQEIHRMYIYSLGDIKEFCGEEFQIEEIQKTKSWQTWIKCKRK